MHTTIVYNCVKSGIFNNIQHFAVVFGAFCWFLAAFVVRHSLMCQVRIRFCCVVMVGA